MRILVVDDHEFVRKGISSILAQDSSLTLCGEAVDGRDAIEKAQLLRPDVVVMDISMPRLNGLDATREIKRLVPTAEVIILSQHENPEMIRQAAQAGARGYVAKSSVSSELVSALTKVGQKQDVWEGREVPCDDPILDTKEILKRSAALEQALRGSEERFRSAMNNMAEGLYTVDGQGMVTYVNPAAEEIFGWSSDELLGKKMHDLAHYQRPDGTPFPASECPALGVLQSGVPLQEHQDHFIRKDGSFFPVVFSAAPLKAGEKTVGLVVCFRDDSERRQFVETLEARISERTSELAQATKRLRELSATLLQTQDEERRRIARELHDGIGQDVAAIKMNLSGIARERAKLSESAGRALDENILLVEEASQQIRTMSHLLHPPLLDEVGLESALRWYVEGFAERGKIKVQMDLAPGFGDHIPRDLALSMFRIVQECLTNIHRHSGSPSALIAIDRTPNEIVLHIEDHGHGIPREKQLRIFSGESSGVGLRGMQERVRQFGGSLDLRSDATGTKVTATIPVPAAGLSNVNVLESEDEEVPADVSEDEAPTVLCIDDDPTGLMTRRLLLESAGYRVIEARSGSEGIDLFRAAKVDAVILDYWMSEMKGTVVALELKRIDPTVPIIVLSGVSELPGEAVGLFDLWLVKGTHRAERLLESLGSLLEHPRSTA
jgi:PAS domain S-box-containing protein